VRLTYSWPKLHSNAIFGGAARTSVLLSTRHARAPVAVAVNDVPEIPRSRESSRCRCTGGVTGPTGDTPELRVGPGPVDGDGDGDGAGEGEGGAGSAEAVPPTTVIA
jgi:hypothetical protein